MMLMIAMSAIIIINKYSHSNTDVENCSNGHKNNNELHANT